MNHLPQPNPSSSYKPYLIVIGIALAIILIANFLSMSGSLTGLFAAKTEPPSTPQAGLDTQETLQELQQAIIPIADAGDIAARLDGKRGVPEVVTSTPPVFQIGAQHDFWLLNDTTSEHFKVHAHLVYISTHLYLWVEDGLNPPQAALQQLGDTFETKIYPTDRAFFGSEWTPGVDNDPHLYIVFAGGLPGRVGAYFSAEDEINPAIDPYSNGHELFVVNANVYPGAGPDVDGVLAHEFQHMIEYNQHRNMEGWMDEGFSVLATYINDYGTENYEKYFASNPDTQLNDFPNDKTNVVQHYGAAFLFLDYFLSRFGSQATGILAKEPEDGLDGVDAALKDLDIKDPASGQPVNADDFFVDWTVANYLDDPGVGDGRFAYSNYPAAPRLGDTSTISRCPAQDQSATLHQYSASYIRISCRGDFTLTFQGNSTVPVLPVGPHSGAYDFYSNKGDVSDMSLTHAFDLTDVSSPVNMTYWTWYDLEKNYDYAYLEASTDGQTWVTLKTTTGTADNPGGANLGIGYTGASGTWIQETVDLSKYAGRKIQLRFEYITDAETYGEGFLLDDVSIPQIGYKTDFEKDDGGWIAKGFVRIQDFLPQSFRITLIDLGAKKSVRYLEINNNQTLTLPLHLENDVVLVVSGTTRYTRQTANYSLSIR